MSKKDRQSTRHGERERAFQVLYSLCFTPVQDLAGLKEAFTHKPSGVESSNKADSASEEASLPEAVGFAWELTQGVWQHEKEIDSLIEKHSLRWRVERMGKIELTILRIGVYELVFSHDTPAKVALDEAIELAKSFAADGSDSFINGILDAVARSVAQTKTA